MLRAGPPGFFGLTDLFIVAMLVYDLATRRKVHPATIWGGLVPWNQVWRTGANEATHFRTSRDLLFGETRVPAGSYTLWSVPGPEGWTIIFNRQTGQWGTVYDPAQDLARIPAQSRRTSGPPVEQLTLGIHPDECGAGGVLAIEWENTRVQAPFTVAP